MDCCHRSIPVDCRAASGMTYKAARDRKTAASAPPAARSSAEREDEAAAPPPPPPPPPPGDPVWGRFAAFQHSWNSAFDGRFDAHIFSEYSTARERSRAETYSTSVACTDTR